MNEWEIYAVQCGVKRPVNKCNNDANESHGQMHVANRDPKKRKLWELSC